MPSSPAGNAEGLIHDPAEAVRLTRRAIRNGDESQLKTVRITLKSEDHAQTVATWVLKRARIIKYVSGPFNAKGTDVAMEELTLSYERLEVEDVA